MSDKYIKELTEEFKQNFTIIFYSMVVIIPIFIILEGLHWLTKVDFFNFIAIYLLFFWIFILILVLIKVIKFHINMLIRDIKDIWKV